MSTTTLTNAINSLVSDFDARTRRLAAALGISLVFVFSVASGTLANDDVTAYQQAYFISPDITDVISIASSGTSVVGAIPGQDAPTYTGATRSGITENASIYAFKTFGEDAALAKDAVLAVPGEALGQFMPGGTSGDHVMMSGADIQNLLDAAVRAYDKRITNIVVPSELWEGDPETVVSDWWVSDGANIGAGLPVASVITSTEYGAHIRAPASGLLHIHENVDAIVEKGTVIGVVEGPLITSYGVSWHVGN